MVALISAGVPQPGGIWADFGAGTGNFTWALAELLGSQAIIYALDRDAKAIVAQRARCQFQPPAATIIAQQADVTRLLELPPLDGLLLANLLHFLPHQVNVLQRVASYLKPMRPLILVEYEQASPLPWVPFPVPFARFQQLTSMAGLAAPHMIGSRASPSSGKVLYAAATASIDAHAI